MNNATWWRGVLIAVLVIGAATAVGIGSYNAGVAHGLVEGGAAVAPPPGTVTYAHGYHRSWGHGFFPLFPLVFLFFFFAMMRAVYWRGPWSGGWRHRYDGIPPAFEEWHRRAHANDPPSSKP